METKINYKSSDFFENHLQGINCCNLEIQGYTYIAIICENIRVYMRLSGERKYN